jgi:hypothetical protein
MPKVRPGASLGLSNILDSWSRLVGPIKGDWESKVAPVATQKFPTSAALGAH